MADNFNNIRVIQVYEDDSATVKDPIDISDFRTVGEFSLQYAITGSTMTICYSVSLNGTDYHRPRNTNLVFNKVGTGFMTFQTPICRFIRFESFGDGTVNGWLGLQ